MRRSFKKALAFTTALSMVFSTVAMAADTNGNISEVVENEDLVTGGSVKVLASNDYNDAFVTDSGAILISGGYWNEEATTSTKITFVDANGTKKEIKNVNSSGKTVFDTAYARISGTVAWLELEKDGKKAIVKGDGSYYGTSLKYYADVEYISEDLLEVSEDGKNYKLINTAGTVIAGGYANGGMWITYCDGNLVLYKYSTNTMYIYNTSYKLIKTITDVEEIWKSGAYMMVLTTDGDYIMYDKAGAKVMDLPEYDKWYGAGFSAKYYDKGIIIACNRIIDAESGKIIVDDYIDFNGTSYTYGVYEEDASSGYEMLVATIIKNDKGSLDIENYIQKKGAEKGYASVTGRYQLCDDKLLISIYDEENTDKYATFVFDENDGFKKELAEIKGMPRDISYKYDKAYVMYTDLFNNFQSLNMLDGTLVKGGYKGNYRVYTATHDNIYINDTEDVNKAYIIASMTENTTGDQYYLMSDGSIKGGYDYVDYWTSNSGYYVAEEGDNTYFFNTNGTKIFSITTSGIDGVYEDEDGYITIVYEDNSYAIYDYNMKKIYSASYYIYDNYYSNYGRNIKLTGRMLSDGTIKYGAIALAEVDEHTMNNRVIQLYNGNTNVSSGSKDMYIGMTYTINYRISDYYTSWPEKYGSAYVGNSSIASISVNETTGAIKVTPKKEGNTYLYVKTESGYTAKCMIRVKNPISFTENKISMYTQNTYTVKPVLSPTVKSVTYSTGNTAIAKVNSNGVITAVGAGNTYLYVKGSNGYTAKVLISVTKGTPATSVSIRYAEKTIYTGETFKFTATMNPTKATSQVTWRVGNTSIATVDANGKVTAKKAGNTYLYATTTSGKTVKCLLKIKQTIPATSISIRYVDKTIYTGNTFKFTATVTPTNSTTKAVTWKVGNTSIATVDANGKVTAKKAGNTYLYATTANGVTTKCLLKIKQTVPAQTLSIRYASKTITKGQKFKFTATMTPTNTTESVTCKVGNTNIATVDANGNVTAKSVGNTYLYATTTSGITVKCLIKVTQ